MTCFCLQGTHFDKCFLCDTKVDLLKTSLHEVLTSMKYHCRCEAQNVRGHHANWTLNVNATCHEIIYEPDVKNLVKNSTAAPGGLQQKSRHVCLKTYLWMIEDRGGTKGRGLSRTWKECNSLILAQLYINTFLHSWKNWECTMVNQESTPGLTGRDERHVVSHFCYVSSNKLQWGAISSRLISVELVLFYQPPQGRVSFELEAKGAKRCERERETQQKRHQPEVVVCFFYTGQYGLKPELFLWPRRCQNSKK